MQPKPLIRENQPPKTDARHLCDTCVNAEACSLRASQAERVHQCQEYDDGSLLQARRTPVLVSIPEPADSAASADGPHAGLCANCERRTECTLPRAPGGVWFCEEYQ